MFIPALCHSAPGPSRTAPEALSCAPMRYRILRWVGLDPGDFLGQIVVPDQPVLSTVGGICAVLLATIWAHREGLVWWKALLTGGACALMGALLGRVGWLLVDVEWARIAANPYLIIDPTRGGAISFGALCPPPALPWPLTSVQSIADVLVVDMPTVEALWSHVLLRALRKLQPPRAVGGDLPATALPKDRHP